MQFLTACLLIFKYLLVWAQVEQEQSWVVIAGSQDELRQFKHGQTCHNLKQNKIKTVFLFGTTYLEDTPSVAPPCFGQVSWAAPIQWLGQWAVHRTPTWSPENRGN